MDKKRLGRCYELAGREAAFPSGAPAGCLLVHGSIQGFNFPRIGHAWVEHPDGQTWEPTTNQLYDSDVFFHFFNPIEEVRYDREQVQRTMLRYNHWGPWHNEEPLMTIEEYLRPPETAQAINRPCQLHHYHAPRVVRTQGHHRHPVYLQNRVYGRIQDGEVRWVCGTCHDSIHEWLSYLLGEARRPNPEPGTKAKLEAEYAYNWYVMASQA